MIKKTKIAFLIPDLKNGGGQRVASILINNLLDRGYEVACIVYDLNDVAFSFSDQVQLFSMDMKGRKSLWHNRLVDFIMKVTKLRSVLKKIKPDLIFSMMTSMNIIGLCANKDAAILMNHHTFTKKRTVKYYLVKFLYGYADAVVTPSRGLEIELRNLNRNILVQHILNPLEIELVRLQAKEPLKQVTEGPYMVYVGRLSHEKGVDLLIEAFKLLEQLPHHLVIVGDGPELSYLEKLVLDLNLTHRVFFIGTQKNPFNWMKNATCLVLPSRIESFGLVLLEAMAVGCKVVAFDCESGPREVTDAGKYGWLASPLDKNELATQMNRCIHEDLPPNIEKWLMHYEVKNIVSQYDNLIKRLLSIE